MPDLTKATHSLHRRIAAEGNEMEIGQQIAQGDVFITRVAAMPKNLKLVPLEDRAVVLAHGEATGHKHQIKESNLARLFVEETRTTEDELLNVRFLEIVKSVEIVHEEHGALTLQPGIYRVNQQREWTDADEPMRVAD